MSTPAAPAAFLDTSVLVDAVLKTGPEGVAARKAIAGFATREIPHYALKEFKAGALQAYAWFHNKLVTEPTYADAMRAVHGMVRGLRRNLPATVIEAMAEISREVGSTTLDEFQKRFGRSISYDELQRHIFRESTKSRIHKAWRRRASVAKQVYPLACYDEGGPAREPSGTIALGRYVCRYRAKCSLQDHLRPFLDDAEKVKTVVQESSTTGSRQYQALRSLVRTPNRLIDHGDCRALGDAVFALLAPKNAVILTTNIKDHEPLAAVLGKAVQRP